MEPRTADRAADRFLAAVRGRPLMLDAAAAAAAAAVGSFSVPPAGADTGGYAAVVAGCCLAVLAARRLPRAACAVLLLLSALHAAFAGPGLFIGAACLFAAYTAQLRTGPPWRWALTGMAFLVVGGSALAAEQEAGGSASAAVLTAAGAAVTAAALAGALQRRNRARVELALERAVLLAEQREGERRLAVLEERARIARDMHDVLGHSLGTMAMQAEGARYAVRSDPEAAERALADIGRIGRGAMEEVGRLVGVLRTEEPGAEDGPPDAAALRPLPTLRDVPALVDAVQRAGTPVRLRLDGDLSEVPEHVGVAAFRIVQESVTNAVRHAPGASVTVRAAAASGRVEVAVADDGGRAGVGSARHAQGRTGRGADRAHGADPSGPEARQRPGHGLIGMRERAAALGGSVSAGRDPAAGGWRVSAVLPWQQAGEARGQAWAQAEQA